MIKLNTYIDQAALVKGDHISYSPHVLQNSPKVVLA